MIHKFTLSINKCFDAQLNEPTNQKKVPKIVRQRIIKGYHETLCNKQALSLFNKVIN